MKMNSGDEKLTRALADWRVTLVKTPGFRAAVWSRIERQRGEATWGVFMRAHAGRCVALLAVALLVGAWSGRERARTRVESERAALVANYVQALDARTMRMP